LEEGNDSVEVSIMKVGEIIRNDDVSFGNLSM